MIIYRIQNKDGLGPYRGDNNLAWAKVSHNDRKRTPSPCRDLKLKDWYWDNMSRVRDYNFGFESMKQLEKWFTKFELKNLAKRGFKIVRLKVPKNCVVVGDKQVMYMEEYARIYTKGELLKIAV